MMSLPAMTNQSASHRGIANQIDTTTRFCNAQVIKNMSGAGPLRNRPFATHGQRRRPARAAGCFRHQLLLPRPYLVLTKPLRLDIQCQRAASVKIGWKYLDD